MELVIALVCTWESYEDYNQPYKAHGMHIVGTGYMVARVITIMQSWEGQRKKYSQEMVAFLPLHFHRK